MLNNKDVHITIHGKVGSHKGDIAKLIKECLRNKGIHVQIAHPQTDAYYIHDNDKSEIKYQEISVEISCASLADLEI